jgi:hypothetical protein
MMSTPVNVPSSNVWTRRAALFAAPVKQAPLETESLTQEPLEPINLAPVLEAIAEDFEIVGAKGLAANHARMQRQAIRAAQPRVPYVAKPTQTPQTDAPVQVVMPLPATPRPLGPRKVLQGVVQTVDASAASAAAPVPVKKQQNTYTVIFEGKVTENLTFDRLHKATKADLLLAQETMFNQCISAFEYALENDKLLQCIDHISGGFQTRKFVTGAPIVAGKHTFLASDIIKEQFWVYKTRNILNELEPRLHVSFYFDSHTTQVVMSLKKA